MKRFISFLCLMLLLTATTTIQAARSVDDLSAIEGHATITYFQGKAPMLNSLNLYSYGINGDLTRKLKMLQIAVVPTENTQSAREEVRKLVDGWERGLTMNTVRSNIVVWGSPDRNGVYKKVVIGIGTPGRLTYIYMEGDITPEDLSTVLLPFQ